MTENNNLKFLDKTGKQVEVGDFIVYGHAAGRSALLRYGKVLEIYQFTSPWKGSITKIKIIGVNDDYSSRPPTLLSKPSSLEFFNRIIAFKNPIGLMPEKVIAMLNDYAPNSITEEDPAMCEKCGSHDVNLLKNHDGVCAVYDRT